jgi:putative intracellular protease/amidase
MARDLDGMRIAILATDGVERVELEQPRGALYGAGASSDLISIHPGEIQAYQHDLVAAGAFPVDHEVVIDRQYTTSRSPAGLPAFCPAIIEQFARYRVSS